MTNHDTSGQGASREERTEPTEAVWGHSLAAAAVCLATAATIALIAVLD